MFDFRACGREYNIPTIEGGHHHTHQGWIQTHCPFCTDGTHGWHLGFSLTRGTFRCWRCGGHRTWDVLCKLLRGENAARQAWARFKTEGRIIKEAPKPRRKTLWTPPGLAPMGNAHKQYLQKRGFNADQLEEEWGLMGTHHLSGEWNWRVAFPILDPAGRPVAYCGRAIGEEAKPKYKMSHKDDIDGDPRQLLYGIHRAQKDLVVVVEGPADVWRLGPGAVATLGIDWKMEQATILKDFHHRAIMYDPEPQAQRRAHQLAEWLGIYEGTTEIVSGLTSDPGDLSPAEAARIMEELKHG